MKVRGKFMKVLLIMPKFFEYHKKIIECMEKHSISVVWYNDTIQYTLIERIYKKIFKKNLKRKFDSYINNIIEQNSHVKFDKVILIFGGNRFDFNSVKKLKKSFTQAEFIYYAWDSIANFPNILEFYNLFDKKYSFDPYDCEKYGMSFLPLFYTCDYENAEIKYDLSIVMSFYLKKAENYNMLCNAISNELKFKRVIYLRHKSSYIINKLVHPHLLKGYKLRDFVYEPISKDESDKIFLDSKIIVDCPLGDQNGLTIRTFEALRMKKKIITTNAEIKKYDFYNEHNIFVVSKGEKVPKEFILSSFDDNYSISSNYSIDSFVSKLLDLNL